MKPEVKEIIKRKLKKERLTIDGTIDLIERVVREELESQSASH